MKSISIKEVINVIIPVIGVKFCVYHLAIKTSEIIHN